MVSFTLESWTDPVAGCPSQESKLMHNDDACYSGSTLLEQLRGSD